MTVDVTRDELGRAIAAAASRVTALASADGILARRLPRSEWTGAEALTHVAVSQELFAGVAGGAAQPYGDVSAEAFAAINRRLIAADEQPADAPTLGSRSQGATAIFLDRSAKLGADAKLDTPLGVMPVEAVMSYCLCHLLSHGHAIAAAAGAPTPMERGHVRLTLPFLAHATPLSYAMQPTRMRARIAFRVRRAGPRFTLVFDETAATMETSDGEGVDCTVSVDAVTLLLVAFGLQSQWRAAAAGRIASWGRRPWMALRVSALLPSL